MQNSMMMMIFELEKPFFEKLVVNYQSCYKFLFKLFNFIMASRYFGKLVKNLEHAVILQSVLLINNVE